MVEGRGVTQDNRLPQYLPQPGTRWGRRRRLKTCSPTDCRLGGFCLGKSGWRVVLPQKRFRGGRGELYQIPGPVVVAIDVHHHLNTGEVVEHPEEHALFLHGVVAANPRIDDGALRTKQFVQHRRDGLIVVELRPKRHRVANEGAPRRNLKALIPTESVAVAAFIGGGNGLAVDGMVHIPPAGTVAKTEVGVSHPIIRIRTGLRWYVGERTVP